MGFYNINKIKLMLKKSILTFVFALTVVAWSNLQVETVPPSNPFVGNKFTITNVKPIFEDRKFWISFREKKLEFNGCNEEVFSGEYTMKENQRQHGKFEFELSEPFDLERGCRPVNIIKAVLNSGVVISSEQNQGSFRLSNPNYPSAYLLFEKELQ